MSFITRATLKRSTPTARALAALLSEHKDNGHRTVWTLFGESPDAKRDFLFREGEPGSFLIVSERRPTDPHQLWELQTKPYALAPTAGQRFGFGLRANPVRALSREGKLSAHVDAVMQAKTLKGEALTAEERQTAALDWLTEREARLGVRFDRALCTADGYRQLSIARKPARSIRLSVIDYEGVLEVTDGDALSRALGSGIGKARAYGCGLLLLRPLGG